MFAKWTRRSGFSDPINYEMGVVKILGFAETTIYPGYQSGSKTCVCAVVADESGQFVTVELSELTYVGETNP